MNVRRQDQLNQARRSEWIVEILHEEMAARTSSARIREGQRASRHRNVAIGCPVESDLLVQSRQCTGFPRPDEQTRRANRAGGEEHVFARESSRRAYDL